LISRFSTGVQHRPDLGSVKKTLIKGAAAMAAGVAEN
jgi:hypothetical protein